MTEAGMSVGLLPGEEAAGESAAERRRASQVLLEIAGSGGPQLTLDEMLERLGDRGFGLMLLILGLFNCAPLPPGASTIFGATLMLVAAQMLIGRHRLWLPRFVRRRSVPRSMFRAAAERVAPVLQRIERLCRPRHSWLTAGASERLIGAVVLVLAFVITLPIPIIGNIPPGFAVAILAISLVERDGLAALAGMAAGAVAFAINAGVVFAVGLAAIEAVQRLLAGA